MLKQMTKRELYDRLAELRIACEREDALAVDQVVQNDSRFKKFALRTKRSRVLHAQKRGVIRELKKRKLNSNLIVQ